MQDDVVWRERRQRLQEAAAAGDVAGALQASRELLVLERGADIAFCATAFRKLRPALLEAGHRLLRTFLVRSVTLEPLLPALQVEAVLNGYVLDLKVGGYGSYMVELMHPGESIDGFAADLVCVLLDTEDLAGSLPAICARGRQEEVEAEVLSAADRVGQMLRSFRAASSARLLLQGCVLPVSTSLGFVGEGNMSHGLLSALRQLNQALRELSRAIPDCVFFDVEDEAARFGRQRWRDERMFLATRLPVAPSAFRSFSHGLLRCASTLFRAPRKVLCTDLDNTLWGGVLGEDGPMGIATGSAFPGNCFLAYQQYLKELAARGILLAIASKNNEADVVEAFDLRAADLGLSLADFVARKISWNDKVQALRELAAELSLGLDSFVFIDDNPTECEAVRRHLPEVTVVQAPAEEPWRMTALLADQWFFDSASVTADDRSRAGEYKAQSQRAALSQSATSKEDFLSSLDIVCTFLSAADAPLDRSVQLLSKTNQFNLTTRRHSASDVMAFVNDPACQAIAVRVRDRFGDAGVVGLALARQEADTCTIDTLLLSCRVIGRGIESAMLAQIADRAAACGARWLIGEFIETKKNTPCKDFYPQHGFQPLPEPSQELLTRYRLDLALQLPGSPAWLTLERNEKYEQQSCAPVPA